MNIFNRFLRERIRKGVPRIWWNTLFNCATNRKGEHIHVSVLLSTNVIIDSFVIESGHSCFNCSFLLDENSSEIFDGLSELESSFPEDTKMVLVYIAGYITRNDSA